MQHGQGDRVSVDVAGRLHRSADNAIGHLFDWFSNGDLEVPTASHSITCHLNQRSFDSLPYGATYAFRSGITSMPGEEDRQDGGPRSH
jgi:hypothetical protein